MIIKALILAYYKQDFKNIIKIDLSKYIISRILF